MDNIHDSEVTDTKKTQQDNTRQHKKKPSDSTWTIPQDSELFINFNLF
jgi:hypothetical protein